MANDDGSLAHAMAQAKLWEEHMQHMMLSHDLYMTKGTYLRDSSNASYWAQQVRLRKEKEQ